MQVFPYYNVKFSLPYPKKSPQSSLLCCDTKTRDQISESYITTIKVAVFNALFHHRNIIFGTVIRLRARQHGYFGSNPDSARKTLLCLVQTGFWTNPVTYPKNSGGAIFARIKLSGCEADNSPPSSAVAINALSDIFISYVPCMKHIFLRVDPYIIYVRFSFASARRDWSVSYNTRKKKRGKPESQVTSRHLSIAS
jgi:hypothetical protein